MSVLLRRAIAICVMLSAVGATPLEAQQVVKRDNRAERDRIVQTNRVTSVLEPRSDHLQISLYPTQPLLHPLSVDLFKHSQNAVQRLETRPLGGLLTLLPALSIGMGLGAAMMYLILRRTQRTTSRSDPATSDRDTTLKDESFYRAILNALPDLIIHMHRDGTYLDVKFTDAFPLAITPESVGKNVRELLSKPVAEQRLAAAQQALQTGEIQVYEFPFWVKGQRLWEETRIVPLNADEVVVVIRDLTQRQHIEEALRQSEANLLQAQRIVHMGSWEMDLATQDIRWSEELFRIFGRDPDQAEPTYAELLNMLPVEDQRRLSEDIQQAIAHQVPYEVEHRIYRPDGTLRYVISKGQTNDEDGQKATKIYGTVLDITERKRVELALQESEARFRQLAETVEDGFFVFEIESAHYSYVNPALIRLIAPPVTPIPTEAGFAAGLSHPLDNIYAEDRPRVEAALQQAWKGQDFDQEYRFIRPDGAARWLRSRGFPILDAEGHLVRIVGTVEDITERKQLEQSLRSQAEEERLLTTITQNIRQSLDLEEILATTVVEVQQMLNADRALIFRLDDDHSGQVIQEAVTPDYVITDQMRWEDEHFPERCYAYYSQGLPRVVPDVAKDKWADCLANFMQTAGVKSKIVAPIVKDLGGTTTTVWGLLIVHACSHCRQWQDFEVALLQRICNQLAIAIDQANLYQQMQTELAERKQAEETLQEREAMLRAIGDNLPKGFIYQRVYEPGKGFSYSYVSAGIERLLGLKPEDVLADSTTTRTVGFDEDLARADQVAQESLKNLSVVELQMRNRTATGEIRWSSIRSIPRRLPDGRTVWDGVEVDITDLKRIEAALRASEEMFRRAFDDAPFGISLVSTTGYFVKVNPCYCELLGYTEAELLNLRFQDITHPDDLRIDLDGFQKLISGELRTLQLEKRYISKQGTPVPVLVNIALIRDQEGQPLYSVGHVQDIRDRQKVERMKDEFISVVSHELRTPLTSIRGALGLISSGVFDTRPERVKHMLQIATTNSDRLVRLVDDILCLERLQSGKVKLMIEPCSVEEVMRQAVEGVQAIADQAEVTLSLTPLAETLWAAPDGVIQALTNLLSNAIKFSNAGGTVWLKAEVSGMDRDSVGNLSIQALSNPIQPSTPCVIFTVADQGRGIPEDKLDVIFEEFQQVDVSDSRKKGGTGLGLAICKKIVQQHRGKIWVESRIDRGSTFYIALPLTPSEIHE